MTRYINNINLKTADLLATRLGFNITQPYGLNYYYGVAGLYDINGDNLNDMIVGHHIEDPAEGRAYMIYGEKGDFYSNIDLTNSANIHEYGFELKGQDISELSYKARGTGLGITFTNLGDINGDGKNDFSINEGRAQVGGTVWGGRNYIVYGKAKNFTYTDLAHGLSLSEGFRIEGDRAWKGIGSLKNIGDINGDGITDMAVFHMESMSGYNNDDGEVLVLYGRTSSFINHISVGDDILSQGLGFKMFSRAGGYGTDQGHRFGAGGITSMDINGDGINDILVATSPSVSVPGYVYAFHGKNSNFLNNIEDIYTDSDLVGQGIGIKISNAGNGAIFPKNIGDINNDGYDDLMLSAYEQGILYVIYGNNSYLLDDINLSNWDQCHNIGFKIILPTGSKVSSEGFLGLDIDNDSVNDMALGAFEHSNNNGNEAGTVYVIYGKQDNLYQNLDLNTVNITSTNQGFEIWGADTGSKLGIRLSFGDINNDGIDDLFMIGSRSVYAIYGGITQSSSCNNGRIELGDGNWCAKEGSKVYTVDMNNDGKQDLFCHNPQLLDSINNHMLLNSGLGVYNSPNNNINGALNLGENGIWCVEPQEIYFADFNGDGYTDLYCNDPEISQDRDTININNFIFLSINNATDFTAMSGSNVKGSIAIDSGIWCGAENITDPHNILISDLDNNGMDDLICQNPNGVHIMLSNGTAFNPIDICYG